ncbi:uncharacterized protein BDFB_012717, partial [Asbolus verrucosus]
CTLKLFNEYQASGKIADSSEALLGFCQILETIFHNGFVQNQTSFYGMKKMDVHNWMFAIAAHNTANFAYKSCVGEIQNYKSVRTGLGKFRLLMRYCLKRKCLHVPLESLVSPYGSEDDLFKKSLQISSNRTEIFYRKNSIIGDEILSAILLSVLLQCNKINFQLQLDNVAFLDSTWQLPEMVKLEVVPCKNLGMSISFSDDKAVIVHIKPNSVASEFAEISAGDVLANLNGIEINSSCKGRLNTILHSSKGRPINLVIIKAFHKESQNIFPPIKAILQNLQIGVDKIIRNAQHIENGGSRYRFFLADVLFLHRLICSDVSISKNTKIGYRATYLGFIDVGDNGSVKQIEEAVKRRLFISKEVLEEPVIFEVGEMCIKVFNLESNDIILKHSYMQISSCGSPPNKPNYVAYIAGDENCDTASKFTCYIFYVKDIDDASTVLQSIGTYRYIA